MVRLNFNRKCFQRAGVPLLLLISILPLSLATRARARPPGDEVFSTGSSAWDGYAEFARLAQNKLGSQRVVLTKTLDYSQLSADDALMIVHPEQRLDESSLSAFLVDGGRVAVLDDYGRSGGFLRNFGIETRTAPANPLERLRDNPDLAIASPSLQITGQSARGRHPIAAGVEQVMTNHPRVLSHPDLTPVLEIVDEAGMAHPLAVTGVIAQKGRLFVMGDPSVFINFMLRYPDNRKLALGLLEYLTSAHKAPEGSVPAPSRPDSPSRLFIVENAFAETGSYGTNPPLKSTIDTALGEVIDALEDVAQHGLSRQLTLALASLLTAWIFVGLIRRSLGFSQVLSPSYSLRPQLAAQFGPASRVSVLRSEHGSAALSLMELDSALRDAVARRWRTDGGMSPGRIEELAKARGMSAEDAQRLRGVLSELEEYGRSLSRTKPKRATTADLRRLLTETTRLLPLIEKHKMNRRSDDE